eukprot:jgi/Bigna1/73806/fgenesh1_pg.26_\
MAVIPTSLNIGRVLQNPELLHEHKFKIKNLGSTKGEFEFIKTSESQDVDFNPPKGQVLPHSSRVVSIKIDVKETGSKRAAVQVKLTGKAGARLDLFWTVFPPVFDLIEPTLSTPISNYDFGALYYGEKKRFVVRAVNSSSQKISFSVRREEEENKSTVPGKPVKRPKHTLHIFPFNGVLGPYEYADLECWFRPEPDTDLLAEGFKATSDLAVDFKNSEAFFLILPTAEGVTGETRKMHITGRATIADAKLEHDTLDFGETPVNTSLKIESKIRNRSPFLPLKFEFARVGQFRIKPEKGTLRPMESRKFTVIFRPSNLGVFKQQALVTLGNGLRKLILTLKGKAEFAAPKRTQIGGTMRLPEDFKKHITLIDPESSVVLPKRKFIRQPVVDYKTHLDGLEMYTMPAYAGYGDRPPEMHYSYTPEQHEAMLDNKTRYNEYIRKSHKKRVTKNALKMTTKLTDQNPYLTRTVIGGKLLDNELKRNHGLKARNAEEDMGMDFAEGLMEPKIDLPQPDYELPKGRRARGGKKGSKGSKKTGGARRNRKSKPTTQAEMRECEEKIDNDDLLEVQGEPQLVDFGEVYIGATMRKQFTVSNGLDRNLFVEMKIEKENELRNTGQSTMMIPPFSDGVFDLVFSGDSIGEYRKTIYYIVNKYLTFNFFIVAEVIPMNLGLSKKYIRFQFDPYSIKFETEREVILSNPSNIPADFWFTTDSEQFSVEPMTGMVKGQSSLVCLMKWSPSNINGTIQEQMYLHVKNGKKTTLSLTGIMPKPNVSFSQKTLTFEKVAIGGSASAQIKIRNVGKNVTVYKLEDQPTGVVVEPTLALLQPGDKLALRLQYSPKAEEVLDGSIKFNVRGMLKQLKLPVKGLSILPDIAIIQEEFKFGDVELGNRVYHSFTLENRSDVPSRLKIDLTKHKEFSLKFPIKWLDSEPSIMQVLDKNGVPVSQPDSNTNVYKIFLEANSAIKLQIQFFPHKVGEHMIELPIKVRGVPNYPSLRRVLQATAKKCRLIGEPTQLEFGRQIVIDPKEASEPYYRNLVLKSQDTKVIKYKIFVGSTFEKQDNQDVLQQLEYHTFYSKGSAMEIEDRRKREIEIDRKPEEEKETESGWKLLDERMAVDLTQMDAKKKRKQMERLRLKKIMQEQRGNMDIGEVGVWVDEQGREIFWVSNGLGEGKIQPGESVNLSVFFNPLEGRRYDQLLQVVVEDADSKPYLEIPINAMGYYRMLAFDVQEIFLEPIPLGLNSQTVISVINHGYSLLDIDYEVKNKTHNLPINLIFPRGCTVTRSRREAEVIVRYSNKSPSSFTTTIDFLDQETKRFSLPVTGTTDNCLLTIQDFLMKNKNKFRLEKNEVGTPKMRQSAKSRGGEDSDSDIESEDSLRTYENGSYLWRSVDFALRFLRTLSKDPLILSTNNENFPHHFAVAEGKDIINLATKLSGKKFVVAQEAAADHVATDPEAKDDDSYRQYWKFDSFLNFLKSYGALVNMIRPEHLLAQRRYVLLLNNPEFMRRFMKSEMRSTSEITEERRQRIAEFDGKARAAWLTIIYQMVRCFVLNRVTIKALREQPGISKENTKNLDKKNLVSNVYSIHEVILLRWLELHYNKLHPHNPRSICNFDTDLYDGVVFSAVLISNVPWVRNQIDKGRGVEPLLEGVQPGNADQRRKNARSLDFMKPIARDLMLFTLYLFRNLHSFTPKSTITFETVLGGSVTKSIELSNPSKKPLTYYAQYEGSPDFSLLAHSISLAPKGKKGSTATLEVQFVSRFSKVVNGRILLTAVPVAKRIRLQEGVDEMVAKARRKDSERPDEDVKRNPKNNLTKSHAIAQTMVFMLRSHVTHRVPMEVHRIELPCYEMRKIPLKIANPVPVRSEMFLVVNSASRRDMKITLTHSAKYDSLEPLGGKKGRRKGGPKSASLEILESQPCHNNPFWCQQASVKLKAETECEVDIYFMAFALGEYTADVLFLDDLVGEFMYQIIVTVKNPAPLDEVTLYGKFEPRERVEYSLKLGQDNPRLTAARQACLLEIGQLPRAMHRDEKFLKNSAFLVKGTIHIPFAKPQLSSTKESGGCAGENPIPSDEAVTYHTKQKSANKSAEDEPGSNAQSTRDHHNPGGKANHLEFVLDPKHAGNYTTTAVLRSEYDTRVIPIRFELREPRPAPILEFKVPSRKAVEQLIPITNTTADEPWEFTCDIEGKYFKGPDKFSVPPGATVDYVLTFCPDWICEIQGKLTLTRRLKDKPDDIRGFVLKGKGLEPAAQSTAELECKAREECKHTFTVRNEKRSASTFKVESDLPNISGEARITIPANSSRQYELKFKPIAGGELKGSVSFVMQDGSYVWHAVHLKVKPPAHVAELTIQAELRKAAQVEIPIMNPLKEGMVFEVDLKGDGLHGDSFVRLKPNEQAIYSFIFSPMVSGESEGFLRFYNDKAGEYVYVLKLKATSPETEALPQFESIVGVKAYQTITISNPLERSVLLQVKCSDLDHFNLEDVGSDATLKFEPLETREIRVWFLPDDIGKSISMISSKLKGNRTVSVILEPNLWKSQVQTAQLQLVESEVGEWVYSLSGVGKEPVPYNAMDLRSQVSVETSGMVRFRNPFGYDVEVHVSLTVEAKGQRYSGGRRGGKKAFFLQLKKRRETLRPNETLQIPIVFCPSQMINYTGAVNVRVKKKNITFVYPLVGRTEAMKSPKIIRIASKARRVHKEIVELNLKDLRFPSPTATEEFEYEVKMPEDPSQRDLIQLLRTCLKVELLETTLTAPDAKLKLRVRFEPLRPVETYCDVIVLKKTGGCWNFRLLLNATQPEIDDVIHIRAAPSTTSSVAFGLNNMLPGSAEFKAYFIEDTEMFRVSPRKGMLAAEGEDPTRIVISFSPQEYGKPVSATLVILTNMMQWTYDIQGDYPRYTTPQVESRLRETLGVDWGSRLRPNTTGRPKRNAIRDNIKAVRGSMQRKAMGGRSRMQTERWFREMEQREVNNLPRY